jgi:hypothetical protein
MLQEMTIGTGSGLNLMDKARNTTRKQQEEIYQNLTFFALDNKYNWERPDFAKRRREGRKGKRMGRRSEISKARHAEEERLRRARMTGRKKSEYKRKAKKRAAKSRKNG